MKHDLEAEWKRLEAEAERLGAITSAAQDASNAAWRAAFTAELAALRAGGQASGPRAEWILAHLEGRHDDAALALEAMHPNSETAREGARRARAVRVASLAHPGKAVALSVSEAEP